MLSGAVYVIGALGCAFAVNVPMLIGFRLLLGVSVGTGSFVAPLYIAEVAPPKVPGELVSFNHLAVTTGILIAYIVDFLFKGFTDNLRWMLGLAVIPGAALAIGMLTVPHTPRWLAEHGHEEEAGHVLQGCAHMTPTATLSSRTSNTPASRNVERTPRAYSPLRSGPCCWWASAWPCSSNSSVSTPSSTTPPPSCPTPVHVRLDIH